TELKASITEDGKTIKANPESISNKKIRGTIEFSKLGEDKKPLAGAEFTLYSKDNDKLAIATAVSDSKGKVVFENIPYGNYIIKETKAPAGYLLSGTELKANITEDGKTIKANPESISNKKIKGTLELSKIDKSTSKPLANAKIAVYDEDGKLVEEKITDKNGIAKFEQLPYGKYYFMETEAPLGYVKNNEKYTFEIENNGETIKKVLENEKIQQEKPEKPKEQDNFKEPKKPEKPKLELKKPTINLPRTGEKGKLVFYMSGLLLLVLGLIIRKK
ncbi:LPXTG cell wall anchor domain-containing protein, partial [Anaerosalibacter bizertensis]|uniref:MSCRAMM family protein n=1 Tax=Anaerosalibacter bizertensis TaxID=932217 RepID=UPI001C0F0F48